MTIKRLIAVAVAAAAFAGTVSPQSVRAADSVVTAIITTTPAVQTGEAATFQVGLTSNDGQTWPAASVSIGIQLAGTDGTIAAAFADVPSSDDVMPNRTTPTFVTVQLPAQLAGAFAARATVKHGGVLVDVSDVAGIVVGATIAQPSSAAARASAFTGQLASNAVFAARSAQSGTFAFTGKYGADRSYQTNVGLSTTPGAQRPVATIQTAGSVTQIGTFSPSFDPLVFNGPSGTGVNFKRVWGGNRTLSLATVSGAHATSNPFTLSALSYGVPTRAGLLSLTVGDERVDGPVPYGVASFMRSGTLAGLSLIQPADARGFSYGLRYGLVSYDDAISGVRRTDRAVEGLLGFRIRRSSWSFDMQRAGPYFPNLSAPGISPDRETESLQGSIPVGAVALTLGVTGSRDALPGSPSFQKTHTWSENAGISVPLRNGDALAVTLSNSTDHRYAIESLASGNDNTAVSYTARRGATTYALSIASTNQRDSAGNLQHTVQDGVTVARSFGPLQLALGASFTGNHAAAMSGTSLLQAYNASASWTRGDFTVSSQLNRSMMLPFVGIAPVPTTASNLGLTFKPRKSTTSLSATMTQNHGLVSSSSGSLNLARQI